MHFTERIGEEYNIEWNRRHAVSNEKVGGGDKSIGERFSNGYSTIFGELYDLLKLNCEMMK